MDVRLARPTDAPLVLSLALDANSHLVKSHGWPASNFAARSVLRASIPLAMRGRTWIAQDGPRAALLEAEPRQYVIGWDITRLAAQGEADEAIAGVLNAALSHLRNRGVPRLFACACEEAAAHLQSLGFQALAREHVLLGPEVSNHMELPAPAESRYRMPQDAWPLHQLESAVTPPLVRQLEGLTSLDWSRPVKHMTEIVVERDGRVVAWISWGTRLGRNHRRISMLLHPEHADLAPNLLNQAQKHVDTGCRMVARVREYHVEALRAFLGAGFTVVANEVMLLRHSGVELVQAPKARLAVNAVPGIQGLNVQLRNPTLIPSSQPKG